MTIAPKVTAAIGRSQEIERAIARGQRRREFLAPHLEDSNFGAVVEVAEVADADNVIWLRNLQIWTKRSALRRTRVEI